MLCVAEWSTVYVYMGVMFVAEYKRAQVSWGQIVKTVVENLDLIL